MVNTVQDLSVCGVGLRVLNFLKASMRVGRERLTFVTSFHHVGRELSGIMEVTAFARLESYENSDDREVVSEDFSPSRLQNSRGIGAGRSPQLSW